MKAQLI